MLRKIVVTTIFLSALLINGSTGVAAEGRDLADVIMAIDTIWILLAAFLVFIMQAGFAMVESGFTRAKNAGNIIMKNLMDFATGSLMYWIVGFSIMFGLGGTVFGFSGFFLNGNFEHLELGVPIYAFVLFQTMFAATAATIVSGALAERTKFISYLMYSIVITAVIYPVVGYWIWGNGFLADLGMIDFAGSTVVHSVGGWAALVGAYIIGPRKGKYGKDGKVNSLPGHNITLGALGVFLLWFGWFGFNPGSSLSGMDLSIAHIALTTNLAAASGVVAAMVVSWARYGKPDVSLSLNGALAGLVGITAGTADVAPLGAIVIGLIAGIVCIFGVELLDKVLKVDDPVGAVAVHGICGAFGTLSVGFLAVDGGLFYGGGVELLAIQALGVSVVFLWTTVSSFVLFKGINAVVGLRVSESEEMEGLDRGEHGMEAYADFTMKGAHPGEFVVK